MKRPVFNHKEANNPGQLPSLRMVTPVMLLTSFYIEIDLDCLAHSSEEFQIDLQGKESI
jgi:hypothetical protein